jgi:hypothetical protein
MSRSGSASGLTRGLTLVPTASIVTAALVLLRMDVTAHVARRAVLDRTHLPEVLDAEPKFYAVL